MLTILLGATLLLQTPAKPAAPAPAKPAAKATTAAATKPSTGPGPEKALREFFVAVATRDEAKLRTITRPTPDFRWLLVGETLSPDKVEAFRDFAAKVKIRALRAGDVVTLPGGLTIEVAPEEVTADRAVLQAEGNPMPHRVSKLDGRWVVDAAPIIAARKAAAAAAKKKAATQPKAKAASPR